MRNRLINGAMMIDQRNAGASVTQTAALGYCLDRYYLFGSVTSKFTVQQNAGAVTPPVGFINYLGVTSSAATSVGSGDTYFIGQRIEGFNVTDLAWGTANAQAITLSFWVRSSLTGTFGGALRNSSQSRSYPFTYTISSANTWEQKSITIAGDTTGTWLTTNGVGIDIDFNMGTGSTLSGTAGAWATANYTSATGATSVVGTSGATFYITGVQLEKGSTATSFDYRPYGQELQLCQRYYWKLTTSTGWCGSGQTRNGSGSTQFYMALPTTMRATPTATGLGSFIAKTGDGTATTLNSTFVYTTMSNNSAGLEINRQSGTWASERPVLLEGTSGASMEFSAEL
jgi:hypothetical protein